ncbi:hypothetical protein BaRGS_00014793 [Batillaria attramentaria]|uniref:Uncharacterized protein n=1 Tax=Batillaria attramentaria TaxID=370345 RepID=A0ABD0L3S1_9CAEN
MTDDDKALLTRGLAPLTRPSDLLLLLSHYHDLQGPHKKQFVRNTDKARDRANLKSQVTHCTHKQQQLLSHVTTVTHSTSVTGSTATGSMVGNFR